MSFIFQDFARINKKNYRLFQTFFFRLHFKIRNSAFFFTFFHLRFAVLRGVFSLLIYLQRKSLFGKKSGKIVNFCEKKNPPPRDTREGDEEDKKKPAASYFPASAVSSAQGCLTSVFGTGTGISTPPWPPAYNKQKQRTGKRSRDYAVRRERRYGQDSRPISTARLCTSPCLHLRPIDLMVHKGSSGGPNPRGCHVLRPASRLDAFSGYPFRTQLPGTCHWRDNRHTGGPSTSVLSY